MPGIKQYRVTATLRVTYTMDEPYDLISVSGDFETEADGSFYWETSQESEAEFTFVVSAEDEEDAERIVREGVDIAYEHSSEFNLDEIEIDEIEEIDERSREERLADSLKALIEALESSDSSVSFPALIREGREALDYTD